MHILMQFQLVHTVSISAHRKVPISAQFPTCLARRSCSGVHEFLQSNTTLVRNVNSTVLSFPHHING